MVYSRCVTQCLLNYVFLWFCVNMCSCRLSFPCYIYTPYFTIYLDHKLTYMSFSNVGYYYYYGRINFLLFSRAGLTNSDNNTCYLGHFHCNALRLLVMSSHLQLCICHPSSRGLRVQDEVRQCSCSTCILTFSDP